MQLAAVVAKVLWGERVVVRDMLALKWAWRRLPRTPQGDGAPVMVLPGYLGFDEASGLLRWYLRRLGYDAQGWGLGQNTGQVNRFANAVAKQVQALQAAHAGQPVSLIGWSLGGVIGRQVSRQIPTAVSQVITLGSPINARHRSAFGELIPPDRAAELIARVDARESIPVPVPLTVVYSKADRVVPWRGSLDEHNPHADHIEVDCSHIGLVLHPDVLSLLASKLNKHPNNGARSA